MQFSLPSRLYKFDVELISSAHLDVLNRPITWCNRTEHNRLSIWSDERSHLYIDFADWTWYICKRKVARYRKTRDRGSIRTNCLKAVCAKITRSAVYKYLQISELPWLSKGANILRWRRTRKQAIILAFRSGNLKIFELFDIPHPPHHSSHSGRKTDIHCVCDHFAESSRAEETRTSRVETCRHSPRRTLLPLNHNYFIRLFQRRIYKITRDDQRRVSELVLNRYERVRWWS